ncbi:MAG TPA: MFS transporter, partial [Pyrinomonadaceae bacterium]|nr:MFS transporter [Pyrinomonadaceae bacterium]
MSETTDSVESTAGPKSESEIAPPMSAGASATGAAVAVLEEVNTRIGRRRWLICALLFFAATINYIDRQVIGILKPTLQAEIGWTEIEYSWIVFSFQAAYALGLLFVGNFIDKVGTRVGASLSITVWSFAAMAHALASSVMGFAAARFALGIGEAGYFPGAIKTVSEWFPKKERALATGIFNSGTNVGALATPLIVPWLATAYGWQEAFIVTGAIGFIWLVLWLWIYRKPEDDTRLSKAEFAYIRS